MPGADLVAPIVATRYTAPTLPTHLMGIGPWSTAVSWRGAPNQGVSAGRRISAPIINLPMADSKSVTLRLNDASEAKTSHYFARREAVVIEEMITDLWWRRRDPRRNVVDGIGRFNATTVDIDLTTDGGVNLSATYTDYQGLLLDRINMVYLNTTTNQSQWAKNTLVTDILRWALPTNMGLDLTGIQAATPDITAKVKEAFYIPLGSTVEQIMKALQTISDVPFEWWVAMPTSDTARPRLTLATARGLDRGVILFDIGGLGPIEKWSRQASGTKYANAVIFTGHDEGGTSPSGGGSAIVTYPDQIATYMQRDAAFSDDSISTQKNAAGIPVTLKAAAEKKLAELATPDPTYTVTLRQGFWEGRTHIDVGDYVGIRLELGLEVITGKPRCTEIQVDIDAEGFETVTLTLGPPRPAKDPRSRVSSTAKLVRYLARNVPPAVTPTYYY